MRGIMELIRIKEAAQRLGVSRATIYHLINTKRLPVTEIAGVTFIDAANLSLPEVVNRPNGRPPINGGSKTNA